jgi:uncharacterized protein YutE (UPF0331/DUF86 family)
VNSSAFASKPWQSGAHKVVDADKARRLIQTLLDAVSDLHRYGRSLTRDKLAADRDSQHMVLHAMYVAVQATVDLAMHVAADRGLPQPVTYRAVFRQLADAGVIEQPLAERLEGWAGFRNVLAHFYSTVDYDRVHAALSEVADLEAFVNAVNQLMKEA